VEIFSLEDFLAFFLILMRLTAFMTASPMLSAKGLPNLLKIGFCLVFSYILYLIMPHEVALLHGSLLEFALLAAKEVLFGLGLGYSVNLILVSMQMAGQMVDFQIGLSMAEFYDPLTNSRVSVFGNLYHWIGMTLFFVLNAHHILIYSFVESFELVPLTGIDLGTIDLGAVVDIFSGTFVTAFQIAIPVIFVLLLTDVVMGLLSRAVPQINILMLSLPIKILVGMLALTVILPAIGNMMANAISGLQGRMEEFFQSIPSMLLFAAAGEEKTEEPTPKRKEDARKKGQVPKSHDLNSAAILVLLVILISILGDSTYTGIFNALRISLESGLSYNVNIGNAGQILLGHLLNYMKITLPIMLIVMIAGILANIMQTGFIRSTHPIKPDLNRLNPIEGFRNIVSQRALVELVKNVIKLVIIGNIAYSYISKNLSNILASPQYNPQRLLPVFMETVRGLMIQVGIGLVILAIIDYMYQRYAFRKSLKMTKQEIKEELKEQEGDPQIRSRIRQKQRQLAMSRMMAYVPEATVVVTNPTHLAIALKYEEASGRAPVVVAKGADFVAERIKSIAREASVPIIENKPLAQALYKDADIGREIPVELYQAVAEILAIVYRMEGRYRAHV